jgi:hypothetical protein
MRIVCESCGAVAEAVVRAGSGGVAEVTCGSCGSAQRLEPTAPEAEPTADLEASPGPTASEDSTPRTALPDDDAWSELLGRWTDEAAHRAYLARFSDLPGLTEAGARYREVLDRRPNDPMALRARDEIVKRASVLALSQLPRTKPPQETPRWMKRIMMLLVLLLGLGAVVLILRLVSQTRELPIP